MPHSIPSLFSGVAFDRHRVFETSDFDEVCFRSSKLFSPHRIVARPRMNAGRSKLDAIEVGALMLSRFSWGSGIGVEPEALDEHYLIVLPTRGKARFQFSERVLEASPAVAAIVNAASRFRFSVSDDYEQIVLRVNRQAVTQAWCALMGAAPANAILFDSTIRVGGAGWAALNPILDLISRCAGLAAANGAANTPLLGRLEDMLATSLLLNQPHTGAHTLWPSPPRAHSRTLGRALEFMQDNLAEPITGTDVAAHCAVSVRSLQLLFKAEVGIGAMQWLRQQRLEAVRRHLGLRRSHQDSRSIGEVALAYGFTHLGEFSTAYRLAFGETPRQTANSRH